MKPATREVQLVAVALFLALAWYGSFRGANLLLESTLRDDGTVVMIPTLMFQGAPLSHYREVHAVAWGFHEASDTPAGRTLAGLIAGIAALVWWLAARSKLRAAWKLALTATLVEAWLVVLQVPIAAAMAFHHVGWVMPCNHQPGGTLFILHLATTLLWGIPVLAVRRPPQMTVAGRDSTDLKPSA